MSAREFIKIPRAEYENLLLSVGQYKIMKEMDLESEAVRGRGDEPSCEEEDVDVILGCPARDDGPPRLTNGRIECTRCGYINGYQGGRCLPLTISAIQRARELPLACGSSPLDARDGCMGHWRPSGISEGENRTNRTDEHGLAFYQACRDRKQGQQEEAFRRSMHSRQSNTLHIRQ